MELNDFISGERFQAIAEVSIIPLGDAVGESECYFVKEQQKNNNYNAFYYTTDTNAIPDHVQNSKIIFVNTWTLDKFFATIYPLLKNKYIFISHNSDVSFDQKYEQYLNDKKVIKWYSQNALLVHPKLFSLPIGLGNQQYPHGNTHLLKSIIEKNIQKDILVFKNFNIDTNRHDRSIVNAITDVNGIPMSSGVNQTDYFEYIARSKFVISPPGNGPDCHRIWECLYLKTIPIVGNNSCFNQFKDLPILFIDRWEDVTITWLRSQLLNFSTDITYSEKLTMKYWINTICTL